MSEDEKIDEIERKTDKIISCISTSDTYKEFKKCIEEKPSHYEIQQKFTKIAHER